MLVWYIAYRCAMYRARLKPDDYTCRTVRKRLVDAGSNPASSTICKTPTRLSWGFFLGDRACCLVFLRVRAESCGPCPQHHQAGSAPGSLSSGHFSLQPSRPEMGRSPQDPPAGANKINNLRVDESNGLLMYLVGGRTFDPVRMSVNHTKGIQIATVFCVTL